MRRVEKEERVGEGAQKQVTRRISCLAVASKGRIEEAKMDSLLPVVSGEAEEVLVKEGAEVRGWGLLGCGHSISVDEAGCR